MPWAFRRDEVRLWEKPPVAGEERDEGLALNKNHPFWGTHFTLMALNSYNWDYVYIIYYNLSYGSYNPS